MAAAVVTSFSRALRMSSRLVHKSIKPSLSQAEESPLSVLSARLSFRRSDSALEGLEPEDSAFEGFEPEDSAFAGLEPDDADRFTFSGLFFDMFGLVD